MYIYFAAFRHDVEGFGDQKFHESCIIPFTEEEKEKMDYFQLICETIFFIDFCTKFILEYVPLDFIARPVRDIKLITIKYIKGNFLLDLIPLIPFTSITEFTGSRLFFLIKTIRILKSLNILDQQYFMKAVKMYYKYEPLPNGRNHEELI